ncbi:hypothetical protein [Sporosarcina sp. P13]|uniref:hypothetical protein n=1 Tax=Sporosarcina sp. P13 TaxID=2048263 RepID=UPI00117B41F7|nr:hypothetical protein [Sporosarcina sp. P13]
MNLPNFLLTSKNYATHFPSPNEGALQAVGGAMRQIGGLPVWLIAGAIRQRRSGYSDDYYTIYRSVLMYLELIESLTNFKEQQALLPPLFRQ